jgi:hypothetical protein
MNRDQKLLQEAYESIYNDSLTSFEESLVKKAAQDITALYFSTKRDVKMMLVLFKDLLDLRAAIKLLCSNDNIKDFLYEKITNSLYDITIYKNTFNYRVSSKHETLTGTEENLEEFLYKVFSDALLGFFEVTKKVKYSGTNPKAGDYIKNTREMQKRVDKELDKDFDIDLQDF